MKTPKLLGLFVSALFLAAPAVSLAEYEPECTTLEEARDLALAEIDTAIEAEANTCTTPKQFKALKAIVKAYTKSDISNFKSRVKIAKARRTAMIKLLGCEDRAGIVDCAEYNDQNDLESGCKMDTELGVLTSCLYEDLSTTETKALNACNKTFKKSIDKEKLAVVKFNTRTLKTNEAKYTKALAKLSGPANASCKGYWTDTVKDLADDFLSKAILFSNCTFQWDIDNHNHMASGKLVAAVPTPREQEEGNGCPMPRPTATATPLPTATNTPVPAPQQ